MSVMEAVTAQWEREGFSRSVAEKLAASDFEGALSAFNAEHPLFDREWVLLLMEARLMQERRNR